VAFFTTVLEIKIVITPHAYFPPLLSITKFQPIIILWQARSLKLNIILM
jgi:hypothetical protein